MELKVLSTQHNVWRTANRNSRQQQSIRRRNTGRGNIPRSMCVCVYALHFVLTFRVTQAHDHTIKRGAAGFSEQRLMTAGGTGSHILHSLSYILFLVSLSPLDIPVSYTHLDVYKRQALNLKQL